MTSAAGAAGAALGAARGARAGKEAAPAAPAANAPLLLGHRGHRLARRGLFPEEENTLAAFARALRGGCDGVELDLRLTGDERLVITHDPKLRGLRVAECSLRELRRSHPGLATLEQALRRFGERCWFDLEVKAPGCGPKLARALRARPPRRGYVISAFEPAVLRALAAAMPGAPLCLNLRRPVALRRLRALPLVAVAPHARAARAWYLRRLHAEGWRTLVWTVNRPGAMRALIRAGVGAIISDHPGLLVATCRAPRAGRG